jgi:hypothetical protein
MTMTIDSHVLHDNLVNDTYTRLAEKNDHRTTKLVKHWTYSCCECGSDGELDILAYRGNVRTYYEVKSHYSPISYIKATEQFKRAQRTFPGFDWKFVFVSPELTKRVHVPREEPRVRTHKV